MLVVVSAATAGRALASSAGSVQLTLTSPKVFVGSGHSANITCAVRNGVYVARFGRTARTGVVVHGAGDYTGRAGGGCMSR